MHKSSLEFALGDIPIINRSNSSDSYLMQLSIQEDTYNKNLNQLLTLSGDIELQILKYNITAVIPLQKGAGYDRDSTHLRITDLNQSNGGLEIILNERGVKNYGWKSTILRQQDAVYLLRNQKRNQAIIFKNNREFDLDFPNGSRIVNRTWSLAFEPDLGQGNQIPKITPEWLADAELVRLELMPVTSFTKHVEEKDFELNFPPTDSFRYKKHPRSSNAALNEPVKKEPAKINVEIGK